MASLMKFNESDKRHRATWVLAIAVVILIWRDIHLTQTIKRHVLQQPSSFVESSHSASRQPCNCPVAGSAAARTGVQEKQSSGQTVHGVQAEQIGKPDEVTVLPIGQLGTFDEFLVELKAGLDANLITSRPIYKVFSVETSLAYPYCEGQWLEFGVASGATITKEANYRREVCGTDSANVAGFDTFTGLPEAWGEGDWAQHFKVGAFSLGGDFPTVPPNVKLVKGLFNESLPGFLADLDKSSRALPPIHKNVTFLHIDCDLYAGARDALQLLNDRIHPGCILIFDELFHFPNARDFEVKAMYEWMQYSGRKLQVIGMLGPLPTKDGKVDLDVEGVIHPWYQSAAFVVL